MTCPDPQSCTVLRPSAPARLSTHVIEADTWWYNVSRHKPLFNATGLGLSRFAPMSTPAGRPIPHAYVAQNAIGALLESALHDVWGSTATIQHLDLRGRMLRRVTCTTRLTVIDLQNSQLINHGIERDQIVSSPSEHYWCTRKWAAHYIHHTRRSVEGRLVGGIIWQSRQMELAAAHAKHWVQILLTAGDEIARVAVVYDHDGTLSRSFDVEVIHEDLGRGDGLDLITDMSSDLGLCIEV